MELLPRYEVVVVVAFVFEPGASSTVSSVPIPVVVSVPRLAIAMVLLSDDEVE